MLGMIIPVYAEEATPSSVDLVLPPLIVEFENKSGKAPDLEVPDYGNIVLPDFEISLPDPGDIPINDITFNIPLPDFTEYNYTEKPSFFSEGILGIGDKNHLIGNISLFRLGKDFRFSLSFAHDGLDGFGTNDAGMGYFSRSEIFKGSFNNGDESLMLTGSGSFKEIEDGFQGQVSSYSSVVHRLSNVELGISGGEKISFDGSVSVNLAGKTLTGEIPVSDNESMLSLNGSASFNKGIFNSTLGAGYKYDKLSGLSEKNIVNSDLKLGITLKSMEISASAGIFWIPGISPLFPYSITVDGAYEEKVQYHSSAGYLVKNYLNYDMWENYPYFAINSGTDKGWFWDNQITISPNQYTEIGFNSLYRFMESYMTLMPGSFNTLDGLFNLESISGSYLDVSPFLNISLQSGWNFSFGWDGQLFFDEEILKPVHSLTSEIVYERENTGFSLIGAYSLKPFSAVPSISMEIHYLISNGIVLSLEGTDILNYFSDDRFLTIGNYIEEGGKLTLLTKISL